jgi:hypothetical protein
MTVKVRRYQMETVNWEDAVKYMRYGYKARRKSWLVDDYIFMKHGVLFCDGGFEYIEYITSTSGQWIVFKS